MNTTPIFVSKEQLLELVYEFDQSHASTLRKFINRVEVLSQELDQKATDATSVKGSE